MYSYINIGCECKYTAYSLLCVHTRFERSHDTSTLVLYSYVSSDAITHIVHSGVIAIVQVSLDHVRAHFIEARSSVIININIASSSFLFNIIGMHGIIVSNRT